MPQRLFTFGCSFTNHLLPTWADIMGLVFDQHENWGKSGGGNHYIFYSLLECLARNKITADDTVCIMWSSPAREDRFLHGQWKTTGNIYAENFPKNYVNQFTDPTGYYLTTVYVVDASRKILERLQCKWHFFSMIQLDQIVDLGGKHDKRTYKSLGHTRSMQVESAATKMFQSTLDKIRPSMHEVIFGNDWDSRNDVIIPYATENALKSFRHRYKECAGPDWPTVNDFIDNNITNISPDILHEIDSQFNFFQWRDNILTSRQDTHPIPAEHAEYLERLGFTLDDRQKEFVSYWNHKALTDKYPQFIKLPVKRF